MNNNVRIKLSIMMFAQYFIWGAWWVTLGSYLNASGFDDIIGETYATQGYAAIIAPLFIGVIADRYFSAEKLLGALHLLGAAVLLWISTISESKSLFFGAVLLYMLVYMPTLPLSNSVAFNAMSNTERQFPAVRVLGTIGWICAGLIVGFLQAEKTVLPIQLAAVASVLAGLYAFTLPATPPKALGKIGGNGWRSITGIDVIQKIRDRSFWVFMLCSLLICIPLSFYYAYTNTFLIEQGVERAAAIQTLGQASEIFFMLLLPFAFVRLGIKWVLIVGMLAWSLRYLAFAFGFGESGPVMPLLLLGIALHGICYDLFFVAGQIYVDKNTAPEIRGRAQSFLALVTLGIGTVLGSHLANWIYLSNAVSSTEHSWKIIWLVPSALAAIVAVLFAFTFSSKQDSREKTGASQASALNNE
ncbi:MAG: nucleoside transporter [Flavobacteriales bacterium]|jgi:nucleoside transporter